MKNSIAPFYLRAAQRADTGNLCVCAHPYLGAVGTARRIAPCNRDSRGACPLNETDHPMQRRPDTEAAIVVKGRTASCPHRCLVADVRELRSARQQLYRLGPWIGLASVRCSYS